MIELEKPNKTLLTKQGAFSSQLQHAIDQVRNWLHTTKEYYTAVLDAFDLKSEEVTRISGVVIMGRDRDYNTDDLRKLKWTNLGEVSLYTYDDILKSLISLSETIYDN